MKNASAWTAGIVIAAALGATAGTGSVTPSKGGISANVALTSLGFSPVKQPKVRLVPHSGQAIRKAVVPKVLSFTSTEIVVQVTTGLAGVYDVVVAPRDEGVAPVTLPDTLTIVVPYPASLDPKSGTWKTLLSIHGADFGTPRGRVTIGGRNAAVKQWTDETIRVVVPTRLALGRHSIVVKNRAGASDGTLRFVCNGPLPEPGMRFADEWISADLSGQGHFEASNVTLSGFTVVSSAGSQLLFGGRSQPTNGYPNLFISIRPFDVWRALPYSVGLIALPPTSTSATLAFATATPVAANYIASLGQTGSSLTIKVTAWDGTFLDGEFSGTLVDYAGGNAPIVVTNGQFRTRVVTGN